MPSHDYVYDLHATQAALAAKAQLQEAGMVTVKLEEIVRQKDPELKKCSRAACAWRGWGGHVPDSLKMNPVTVNSAGFRHRDQQKIQILKAVRHAGMRGSQAFPDQAACGATWISR